jgi:hypothetical protein
VTPYDDPRVNGEYVRKLPGSSGAGDAVLVGVVHDHPSSAYRVKTLVEDVGPDVLALELPPLAVPLFERYAEDDRTPPTFGGEMSTAIQAATGAEIAGIDGPSPGFAARLIRNLYRDGASLPGVRTALSSLASVTKHAVVCRLAACLASRTSVRLEVDSPVPHACTWNDDPERQAADEREQVRRAAAVTNALDLTGNVGYRDVTREQHMARRLSTLRRDGDVLAVVGTDHLDPLADRLGDATKPG